MFELTKSPAYMITAILAFGGIMLESYFYL